MKPEKSFWEKGITIDPNYQVLGFLLLVLGGVFCWWKGLGEIPIWVFPKMGVPPNHPF